MTAMPQDFSIQWSIKMPNGELVSDGLSGNPILFSSREAAEEACENVRRNAERIGITEWLGEIVYQYVSPFISDRDNGQQLVAELQAWMQRQQGGTK